MPNDDDAMNASNPGEVSSVRDHEMVDIVNIEEQPLLNPVGNQDEDQRHQMIVPGGPLVHPDHPQGQQEFRQAPPPVVPHGPLQLIDEAEWFNRNALRDEPYGQDSYANQKEAFERVQEEKSYQREVHSRFFQQQTKEDESKQDERDRQLEKWRDLDIDLETGCGEILKVSLKDLAAHSDTVFAMATNRHLFTFEENGETVIDRGTKGQAQLSLSLNAYSKESVQAFLNVLFQLNEMHATPAVATVTTATMSMPSEEYVVDCCRLAHYLQCTSLLETLVETVLLPSVDSDNCLSMCQLADQLAIPVLLETSLDHMLSTVKDVEAQPIWDDLAPELRNWIQNIQSILRSSNRKHVYFSSFNEYLALLTEQHRYYKERLEEAVEQQSQNMAGTPSWLYTQEKIDRQAERVRTMNRFLMEQKKVFGNNDNGTNQHSIYNST